MTFRMTGPYFILPDKQSVPGLRSYSKIDMKDPSMSTLELFVDVLTHNFPSIFNVFNIEIRKHSAHSL